MQIFCEDEIFYEILQIKESELCKNFSTSGEENLKPISKS